MKQELHCYLRVSTQQQVDEGHSIENQRFLGKRISKKLGMKYVEMNEGGLSSMSSRRPMFEELKTGMSIGRVKNVWYLTRSRWSRNTVEDLLMKQHYFKKYGVKVYEGEEGKERNFNDSKDELLDTILTSVQQFDRQQRREISVSGKKHLSLSEGHNSVFMGGTINFGYKNVDKKWTIDKEESKWVKKIFNLYINDVPIVDIKSYLDTNNVKPRRSKTWSLGTLLVMLKNKVYTGEYVWVDKESQEEFTIIIPQIIDHSTFNRVQKKLEKNTKNKGNNSRMYDCLLSDLLTCYCGQNITGHVRQSVGKKVYVCNSKRNKWRGLNVEVCDNRRGMNMDRTDEFVGKEIKRIMTNSHLLKERFKEDILKNKGLKSQEIEQEKNKLEKQIKPLDKQIDITVKSISTNEVNFMTQKTEKKIYQQIKRTLDTEFEELKKKKDVIIDQIDELDNQKDWVDWLGEYGDDLKEKFKKLDTKLLEGLIKEIVVRPTFSKNREGVVKQVGHRFNIKFKLPIINDQLNYVDPNKKSKGYTIENGKRSGDIGTLEVLKPGRKKKPKKK